MAVLLLFMSGIGAMAFAQERAGTAAARLDYAVAVDGDYAVAGAQWQNGFQGAAYVLERSGDGWIVVQELAPADLGRFDHFGASVTIRGGEIIVTAPWHDLLKGAAFVFTREGNQWIERRKIAAASKEYTDAIAAQSNTTPDDSERGAMLATVSPLSGPAPVRRTADALPAVERVTASDGRYEDRVAVSWESTGLDAVVYKIFRGGTLLMVMSSDDTLYNDTTCALGDTSRYCVIVKDMFNDESQEKCDDGSRLLFPPEAVDASDGLYIDRVSITWIDISTINDGYYVYRDTSLIGSTGPVSNSFIDWDATPDEHSNYSVRAFKSGGYLSVPKSDSGWQGVVLPPANVSASDGQYPGFVRITWQDKATNELGYRIYRDGELIDSTAADGTQYDDSNVVDGVTYEYCVETKGPGGTRSIQVCDTGGIGLAAPGNVSASDATFDDRIQITWDDSCDVEDGYEITRSMIVPAPNPSRDFPRPMIMLSQSSVVLDTTAAGITVYDDFDAIPDSTYVYSVRAITDEGGASDAGIDEGTRSVVLAPYDVAATDGTCENRIDITWKSASTTAVLFKVVRNDTLIKSVGGTVRSYSDYNVVNGRNYEYKVTAVTARERQAASAPDTGRRSLKSPTQVSATDGEYENRVVITWTDNSEYELGYHVYRRDLASSDSTLIYTSSALTGSSGASYIDQSCAVTTGPPDFTPVLYRYSVAAFDTKGGATGESVVGADTGSRELLAPTDVRAGDGEYEDRIEITWTDNSNYEDGYVIGRMEGGSLALIDTTGDNYTSYIDTDPIIEASTEYVVYALDANGTSAAGSDYGSITVLAPQSFSASTGYTHGVELKWIDVPTKEAGYRIYRNGGLIATLPEDASSYRDGDATVGVDIPYSIRAFSNAGESAEVTATGRRQPWLWTAMTAASQSINLQDSPFPGSCAVSGDYAIVGDPGEGYSHAKIYQRNANGSWSIDTDLTLSEGFKVGCVDITERFAVVGDIPNYPVAVFIYEQDESDNWPSNASFTLNNPFPFGNFGFSVAISGNILIVGANTGIFSGEACVYEFSETTHEWTWNQTATQALVPSQVVSVDTYGYSVAIDGDVVLVGTKSVDNATNHVYVYERNGSTYDEVRVYDTDGSHDGGKKYIAVGGDIIVVGAHMGSGGTGPGRVLIFERDSNGDWPTGIAPGPQAPTQVLQASDGFAGDQFGYSVAIREDQSIIVGCNNGTGVAYLFERDLDGVWRETMKLGPVGESVDQVALASTAAFASWSWSSTSISPGCRIFDLTPPPPPPASTVTASDGTWQNQIRITWVDSFGDEAGFRVYRGDGTMFEVDPDVTEYEDTDADRGRTYEYCVTKVNGDASEEELGCDFGWYPANGAINGRVATRAGAGVADIPVYLDPPAERALIFDGVRGHACVEDDSTFDFVATRSFTIEAWVLLQSSGSNEAIISKGESAGSYPFLLRTDGEGGNPGRLVFELSDGTPITVESARTNLADDEWHHVACVHDQALDSLKIFIDGARDAAFHYETPPGDITNDDDLFFGGGVTAYYGGLLDEVRIWNVARTATEIQANRFTKIDTITTDLLGYWPCDEGEGKAATDFAGSPPHYSVLANGAFWSESVAPLTTAASTDLTGSYGFDNLPYGDYRVRPSKGERQFQAPYEDITLNEGASAANGVDFIDISSYTISGAIAFAATGCAVPNVEILVDGTMLGVTDKRGKFAVSVDNGSHTIQPQLGDHTFDPVSRTLDVQQDLTAAFSNTTLHTLSGRFGGGCDRYVGTGTIIIRSENLCKAETLVVDSPYTIDLPPQKYIVRVDDVANIPPTLDQLDVQTFFGNLGELEVDLTTEASDTLDITYHAPLTVAVSGFEDFIPCPQLYLEDGTPLPADLPVLLQLEPVPLTFTVDENYGDGTCHLESGTVTIYDGIYDSADTPVVLPIQNGVVEYTTIAATPSLIRDTAPSDNRSYQKNITAVIAVAGKSPITVQQWVLVTGHVAPEGTEFITFISDEMPLYILRDPPGDDSYAFLDEGFTFANTIDFDIGSISHGGTADLEMKWGVDQTLFFGLGAGKITNFTAQNILKDSFKGSQTVAVDDRTEIVWSANKRFSTSQNDLFIGEAGDVFVGAGLNFLFAIVGVIERDECTIKHKTSEGIQPNGFSTAFAYTEYHIQNTLIPELEDKVTYYNSIEEPESAGYCERQVANWQSWLDYNTELKRGAVTTENRSFSAGADFEYTFEWDLINSFTKTTTLHLENQAQAGSAFNLFGAKTNLLLGYTFVQDDVLDLVDWELTGSRSVGYTLSDDDIGDNFTVDIMTDSTYKSPIFAVRGGVSSCPYEPWPDLDSGKEAMVPRYDAYLTINNSTFARVDDVPPDQPATFTLKLSNLSGSGETREYHLRLLSTSNPYGAIVKANGGLIQNGLSFYLPPEVMHEVTLTVERGPTRYSYPDLKVFLYPPCEYANWENGAPLQQADTVSFTVTFDTPCSDVALYEPAPGWMINLAAPSQDIYLMDYLLEIDPDDPETQPIDPDSLLSVGAQYRRLGSGNEGPGPWTDFHEILRPALVTAEDYTSTSFTWTPDVSFVDGIYEVRAFTECAGGRGYSSAVMGTIDRTPPLVFGTPEPADGILSFGEDIAVTFNEPVDCESVDPGSVHLSYVDGPSAGMAIAREMTCDGAGVVITPLAAADSLEGRTLRAEIIGIRDLAGNSMTEAETWEFVYRKNRFAWQDAQLAAVVPYLAPGVVTGVLVNGTGTPVDFTIAIPGTMPWVTAVTPASGTIAAGGTMSVGFTLDPMLAIDAYQGQMTAEAVNPAQGVAVLDLSVTVECQEPEWNITPGDYLYSMTIVGKLNIGGSWSTDTGDRLAAFVGSDLRGVATVSHNPSAPEPYVAYLTVYSNQLVGEMVHFQVWDDSGCKLYNATDRMFAFGDNEMHGSPASPEEFVASEITGSGVLEIPVNEGWTWISTNILSVDMSADAVLYNLSPSPGDLIKDKDNTFAQYEDSLGWEPPFLLDNEKMYMIYLSQAGTIVHVGSPVDPAAVQIPAHDGWNWIGYLPETPLAVTDALDSLRLKNIVSADDMVKSQTAFAQYYTGDEQWYGNLSSMEAGRGYTLYLDKVGSFSFGYPAPGGGSGTSPLVLAASSGSGAPIPVAEGAPEWSVDHHTYQYNMTVTAALQIDGVETLDPGDLVAAFVGEECRGTAAPVFLKDIGRYEVFLMVHSNEAAGEIVTFKAYDADAGVVCGIEEDLAWEANKIVGRVANPFVLHASSSDEESDGGMPSSFDLMQNTPNPFNPVTSIRYDVPADGARVTLRIYDVQGRLVKTLLDGPETAGRKSATWLGTDDHGNVVATGVYFYKMTAPGFAKTRKMVLMK